MASISSWINNLKDALPTSSTIRRLTVSFRSSNRYFDRLLSFGSSDDAAPEEAELQRATAPMLEPDGDVPASELVNGAARPDVRAAAAGGGGGGGGGRDIESGGLVVVPERQADVPAPAAAGGGRTIAELATPAVMSLGVYSSIPVDVQLHHRGDGGEGVRLLYYPLLIAIALAVGSSLCIIFYALMRFDGGRRQEEEEVVESRKRRWMRISIVFFIFAFMLRILLLL